MRPAFRHSTDVPTPVSSAALMKNGPAPMITEKPSSNVNSDASADTPTTNVRRSISRVNVFHAHAATNMLPAMPAVENRYICSTEEVCTPAGNMRMISVEL